MNSHEYLNSLLLKTIFKINPTDGSCLEIEFTDGTKIRLSGSGSGLENDSSTYLMVNGEYI